MFLFWLWFAARGYLMFADETVRMRPSVSARSCQLLKTNRRWVFVSPDPCFFNHRIHTVGIDYPCVSVLHWVLTQCSIAFKALKLALLYAPGVMLALVQVSITPLHKVRKSLLREVLGLES